jgi:hypothetical protein
MLHTARLFEPIVQLPEKKRKKRSLWIEAICDKLGNICPILPCCKRTVLNRIKFLKIYDKQIVALGSSHSAINGKEQQIYEINSRLPIQHPWGCK